MCMDVDGVRVKFQLDFHERTADVHKKKSYAFRDTCLREILSQF